MKLKTRDIVYIGFIAALCAVATTIRIEIPGGAMVHLGSAASLHHLFSFGGLYGGLGAAIGSTLFDLLVDIRNTLYSLSLLKGIAGLIVGGMTAGYLPPSITKPDSILYTHFDCSYYWYNLDCIWLFLSMVVCS